MLDIDKICEQLVLEFDILVEEVTILRRKFEETDFFGQLRNFPNAHYGYLMACMGQIDLLSAYWKGEVRSRGQTERMAAFMERYMYSGQREEVGVAVQLFRHTLMHTGGLRTIYDKSKGVAYAWRVFFTELPAPNVHFTLASGQPVYHQELLAGVPLPHILRIINIDMLKFAEDVRRGLHAYLADLAADPALQANYEVAAPLIAVQHFN